MDKEYEFTWDYVFHGPYKVIINDTSSLNISSSEDFIISDTKTFNIKWNYAITSFTCTGSDCEVVESDSAYDRKVILSNPSATTRLNLNARECTMSDIAFSWNEAWPFSPTSTKWTITRTQTVSTVKKSAINVYNIAKYLAYAQGADSYSITYYDYMSDGRTISGSLDYTGKIDIDNLLVRPNERSDITEDLGAGYLELARIKVYNYDTSYYNGYRYISLLIDKDSKYFHIAEKKEGVPNFSFSQYETGLQIWRYN